MLFVMRVFSTSHNDKFVNQISSKVTVPGPETAYTYPYLDSLSSSWILGSLPALSMAPAYAMKTNDKSMISVADTELLRHIVN